MQPSPINIVHFHNGSGGGVLSVIRNLLLFKQNENITNHVVYTINKKLTKEFIKPQLTGAATEKVFYYSPHWNFYYTCKRLTKLLPDEHAIIIAHDWLELGMVNNLGLKNRVIFFLHGDYDYYYNTALKNNSGIDAFICVADSIKQKLITILPSRKDVISYLRFPVPHHNGVKQKHEGINIVFVGRCTKEKGYDLLPLIANQLSKKIKNVHWHIIGEFMTPEMKAIPWGSEIPVTFYGIVTSEDIQKLLCSMDLIVLPSLLEGMPLNIIEAMKAGVIPIVNDLNGGIQELVEQYITGIKVHKNDITEYENAIEKIMSDNELMYNISSNAKAKAEKMFDPILNTVAIEELYLSLMQHPLRVKRPVKVYGSRLDQHWIPNTITAGIRSQLKKA